MNPKLLILLAVIALTGLGMLYDGYRPAPDAQKPAAPAQDIILAPDFSFTPFGTDKPLRLHDFKGRIILLNFWASWCAPCKEEFPMLLQLAEENPEKLTLIAISADEQEANANSFITQLPETRNLPNVYIAWDRGKAITQDIFRTIRYPETLLISPTLGLRRKIAGAVTPADIAEIRELLAGDSPR